MASVCLLCVKLCATILLIFSVIPVQSKSDSGNYNAYYTDSTILKSDDIYEVHSLQKRAITPPNITEPTLNPIETNRSDRIAPQSNTDGPLKTDNKTPDTNITIINFQGKKAINESVKETKVPQKVEPIKKAPLENSISTPEPILSSTSDPTVAKNNQTNGDGVEISISNFDKELDNLNQTLIDNNITKMQNDSHVYYNSSFTVNPKLGKRYWVNMENTTDVKVNELLSQSHRRAATVKLSFDFPFYGHMVRNVTVATGGFIYTGEYIHSWLAATQYIAPLMANFDTSLGNDSFVQYVDNGTAFTVEWEKVSLRDKPNGGKFTFQATLYDTGDIVFVYKDVPAVMEQIKDDYHPVKVGLSDAYIIDRTILFIRRKTIYEYHRVHFRREDIKNWTVIYLKALPTCLTWKDCESCVTKDIGFSCTWCAGTNRCSSGTDRHRQEWLQKQCDLNQILNSSNCSVRQPEQIHNHFGDHDDDMHQPEDIINHAPMDAAKASRVAHDDVRERHTQQSGHMGVAAVIGVLFTVGIVAFSALILYAYRNPHTSSGQMLIRYRPSQWSWRRGEARYTAATIHM